jgi:hypothetical protein
VRDSTEDAPSPPVYRKLSVTSRAELMAKPRTSELLSPPDIREVR